MDIGGEIHPGSPVERTDVLFSQFTGRKVFLVPPLITEVGIHHTEKPNFCGIFISLLEICPFPVFWVYRTDHKAKSNIKFLNLLILEIQNLSGFY